MGVPRALKPKAELAAESLHCTIVGQYVGDNPAYALVAADLDEMPQ